MKLTDLESNPISQIEYCGVTNCHKRANVCRDLPTGGRVCRCARHYMDEIDRLEVGALSVRINTQLRIEREEQQEIGLIDYRRQALERMRTFVLRYDQRR